MDELKIVRVISLTVWDVSSMTGVKITPESGNNWWRTKRKLPWWTTTCKCDIEWKHTIGIHLKHRRKKYFKVLQWAKCNNNWSRHLIIDFPTQCLYICCELKYCTHEDYLSWHISHFVLFTVLVQTWIVVLMPFYVTLSVFIGWVRGFMCIQGIMLLVGYFDAKSSYSWARGTSDLWQYFIEERVLLCISLCKHHRCY